MAKMTKIEKTAKIKKSLNRKTNLLDEILKFWNMIAN